MERRAHRGVLWADRLRRVLRVCVLLSTVALLIGMTRQPWLAPYVERTGAELRLALDRAVAEDLSEVWLAAEADAALDTGDADRAEVLLALAGRHDRAMPREAELRALLDPPPRERALQCARCAANFESCRGLGEIASCNLPVELTPMGDLNALRRGAAAWWAEEEVDRFDVALAGVGLTATGLAVASGGTSLTVKGGAALMRVARRAGSLSPRLVRVVLASAREPARLRPLISDLARVRGSVGTAATLDLMRHVDDAGDAARLVRVTDAVGPAARGHFAVLGKARVFRAMVRFSRPLLAMWGAMAALAGLVGAMLLNIAIGRVLRLRLHGRG
ncbi:hypothetical protein [Roseobacter sp. HKCCA0434]|uniref:hypothetical protein n=1 Tax=Roseobacter sp. HKCCA0434 TaxID=3079297 RepID=UPI002905C5B5|nr:hypothetical protein [Roseobacter sp. HKCCA0434]